MKRTARVVLTMTFFFSCDLQLHAQSQTSADSIRKQEDLESRIHRVETTVVDLPMGENQAPLRMDLSQLMKLYNVPGLSIEVIDECKMVWVKGYGVIEAGSSTPVSPKTFFLAWTISK